MIINDDNVAIANELRMILQQRTSTVSDAEGVAIILLWSFLIDHAGHEKMDVTELARFQLEDFIKRVGPAIYIEHPIQH